jgi:protein TilB
MGGAGITEEMIRRRSEHNECVLYTLEEEGIERIDTLGVLCPHLRILYMPNNLIACLENMNRLKELQYLNLAMNNIVKVCVAYHLLC